MDNKRFVLLCQHFYPEMVSTGMHMTELAERLAELGWQITVYCARPSWGAEAEPADQILHYKDIEIIRVNTLGDQKKSLLSRALFALSFLWSVGLLLWRQRQQFPAVVVTTNPPFLGLVSWLFSKLFHLPYLLIVYDIYPEIAVNLGVLSPRSPITKIWRQVTHLIFRNAAVLVVIGRDMERIVRQKIPPYLHHRITRIPNWSDEKRVRPIPKHQNGFRHQQGINNVFVVQYAGRMGRTHNLEPIIEAARDLCTEKILFQFVGDGAKKQTLQQLVAQHNLTNVQFLAYQPMECLSEMLSAADLALVCLDEAFTGLSVPSKSYGIMASGTPILGFVQPDSEIGQMITEEACGLVLPNPTAEQISQTLRSLIHNTTTLEAMSAAGHQAFLNKYTLTHAAAAYDTALTRMVAGLSPTFEVEALS
ncbi:MAG: glycosyltransferase family 4 protein [Anaerolineaceae bacterium]|nr:glycosyltransferase family 4 protein [Anaerolineaceae bacterium]